MTFVNLALAALGGGIIATWLGSWLEHLRRFESSRLIVLAELMGNYAIAGSLAVAPTPGPRYSFRAWIEHRDRLATRLQRDPDVWQALTTYYTIIESQPESQEINEEIERMLVYAIANLSGVELNRIEAIPVYGLRKPWTAQGAPEALNPPPWSTDEAREGAEQ